ncbi:MAG: NAD(+)/NADH kinase [Treponema sp.]|nr:NAD(+)/NADH kinase [Treponema sp.]
MKKCLLLVNSYKADSVEMAQKIKPYLEARSIEVEVFTYDGKHAQNKNIEPPFEGMDFVVTLGGDGTVLFASRGCAPLGIPVFAVNLGEFGFLASISKDSWQPELDEFLAGNKKLSSRYMVSCRVVRDGKTVFQGRGMNDVTVASSGASRLVNLNVYHDGAFLGPFKANGLIVATATGSTAYSAAAGGPILCPSVKALLLTPISSFSLSARPIVFADGVLEIVVMAERYPVGISVDGQVSFDLEQDDRIQLEIPECYARLVGATENTFYAALQSKLNWSGGPRA